MLKFLQCEIIKGLNKTNTSIKDYTFYYFSLLFFCYFSLVWYRDDSVASSSGCSYEWWCGNHIRQDPEGHISDSLHGVSGVLRSGPGGSVWIPCPGLRGSGHHGLQLQCPRWAPHPPGESVWASPLQAHPGVQSPAQTPCLQADCQVPGHHLRPSFPSQAVRTGPG